MQKVLVTIQIKNYVDIVGIKDMVNPRKKGYRGEKLFRDKVKEELGIEIRPPSVGSAGDDGKLREFSCEVKNCKTVQFNKWVKQAESNSDGENWLLAIKKINSNEFNFVVSEKTFFRLLRVYMNTM